jgi:nitronate monooxygenase
MYPCSNPELVAAVSEAGGLGVVQPLSLVYVHRREFREGLREIRRATAKPIALNALVEKTTRMYERRMREWVEVALEEGVRFFITALGNPGWVVERAHAAGGRVYHDVTERKWALRARDAGVDGFICVNRRAGGHAGPHEPEALLEELVDLDRPLVAAGGAGDEREFLRLLQLGYAGVQLGTRFIATDECTAHDDYKDAVLAARPEDIVLTDKLSGVPCSVIRTEYVDRLGLRAGPLARRLLRHPRTRHLVRSWYALRSMRRLAHAASRGVSYRNLFQAGQSVGGVQRIEPAGEVVRRFAAVLECRGRAASGPEGTAGQGSES